MMELLLLLLLIKHAVVDLFLQCFHPTMNKRMYFGGWPHYLEHAVFTLLICCAFFSFEIAFMLAAIDGVLHWHIDYTVCGSKPALYNLLCSSSYWIRVELTRVLCSYT